MFSSAALTRFTRFGRIFFCALTLVFSGIAHSEDRERVTTPNFEQAMQYNSQYVRQYVYDTSVTPHWIGKTDAFWYSFRTSTGTHYWRVNPKFGTKEPLFDRVTLAAQLAVMVQKPLDASQLSLSRVSLNDEGTKLKFVADDFQYEYELATEKLAKLGKAPAAAPSGFGGGSMSREEFERRREEFLRQRDEQQRQEQDQQRRDQDQQQQEQQQDEQQRERQDDQQTQQQSGRGGPGGGSRTIDYRNFSPDRSMYVFAKGHNLFLVELKPEEPKPAAAPADADKKTDSAKPTETKTDDAKSSETKADDKQKDDKQADEKKAGDAKKADEKKAEEKNADEKKEGVKKTDEKQESQQKADAKSPAPQEQARPTTPDAPAAADSPKPIPKLDPKQDETAIQLTTDGVEDYSFAGGFGGFGGFGRGRDEGSGQNTTTSTITPDRKTRPNINWSKDSKSFYVSRSDSRGVKELWVINSLADPRPTLEKYRYPMPGEEAIRKSELHVFHRDAKKLTRVAPKWKDENYQNAHYGKSGDELRFIRRDRLLRHIEFCSLNIATGETKCLISEGFDNANILNLSYRYLDETDELIWWSERSGWGHFYLYDRNGTLKNAITSGPYRTSRIVDVDVKNRTLYFLGNGREPNENIYFEHLYGVRLDGTGLAILDPGNATHRSVLSPSKQYLVDNCSRVDAAPKAILRDASGKEILLLEKADLSRLTEAGWRLPETFIVKAADGVTDLYGNLWKPFDFDPQKKYPIIANVYPGPQTEGVTHTFASSGGTMQLAQLGFIVIQVGHRGGAPTRSKAYSSYGYFNLRDYGLADKKFAIEQLAARHPWIDINRVGIYGHSGGGFMTAAALLQKPYNEFFKVGIATSGNHDNNVYNNSWSERYHGLKEVAVTDSKSQTSQAGTSGSRGFQGGTGRQGGGSGTQERRGGEGASDVFQTKDEDLLDEELALEELLSLINPEWTPPAHLAARWGGRANPDSPDFNPQDGQQTKTDAQQGEQKQDGEKTSADDKKATEQKAGDAKADDSKAAEKKVDDTKADAKKAVAEEKKTKFEIKVPTNQELAANLKGRLLLVHGEIDNNVHPANTMRLVDALIKANKRFDMLVIPGKRHSYGDSQPYVTQRMWEYFAEHLMGENPAGADIYEKPATRTGR